MADDRALDQIAPVAFWYLRHGETDWNAEGRSQGQTDIPLNATGLAQARAAGPLLANRGIVSIVASPLSRARVTAEIVGDALGLPVALDDALKEVRFGVHEGRTHGGWMPDWVAGRYTPEGGETFAQLRARTAGGVNRALERPPAVLVVAHGAVFRALRDAMGIAPTTPTRNAQPIFCEPPRAAGQAWSLTYLE